MLGFNRECYAAYSNCVLKQKCLDVYLNARTECGTVFLYDTDKYDPSCVKGVYDKTTNTNARNLADCL